MNKFKKATKRITAVAASAVMVSSAVLGAGLSNYPSNFVSDDKFSGQVVVGADAAPADTTAAMSIINDLKAEFSGDAEKVKITYKKVSSSSGDEVLLSDSGKEQNYGEKIDDVLTSSLDNGDSDVLEDGTLKLKTSEDYEQTISLSSNGYFEHALRDELDDEISTHLYFKKGNILTYTLELDSGMNTTDYTDSDVVGKKITILGNEFTIGDDWSDTTTDGFDKLKLIGGANKISLGEGESTTVTVAGTSYEVSVQSVSSDKVLLTVNGNSVSIDEFDSESVAGVSVAVTDLVSSSRDAVKGYAEIVIGGQEILLEDGQEVKINDEDISDVYEDYKVSTTFDNTDGFIGFTLTYEWEGSDGFILMPGDAFEDKVFQAFNIMYEGTNDYETSMVKVYSSGEDLKVDGVLNEGEEFSDVIAHVVDKDSAATPIRLVGGDEDTPFFFGNIDFTGNTYTVQTTAGAEVNTSGTTLGSSTKYIVSTASAADVVYAGTGAELETLFDLTRNAEGNTTVNGVEASEADSGMRFLAGDSDTQYIWELTKYTNKTTDEYSFEDVLSGDTKSDVKESDIASRLSKVTTFTASSANDYISKISLDAGYGEEIAFENEVLLNISKVNQADVDDSVISLRYDTDDLSLDTSTDASTIRIALGDYDTTDDELTMAVSGYYTSWQSGSSYDTVDGDDDVQEYVTPYGTLVRFDNEEAGWVEIYTPDEQVEAQVYMVFGEVASSSELSVTVDADMADDKKAELEDDGYTIVSTEEVASEAVEFDIDAPVMDSSVSGMSDMIVVGGPAVNSVAADLLGLAYPAFGEASGLTAGQAEIRFFQASNSVLVYGWAAEDTAAAAARLNEGGLSGDLVDVQ